MVNLVSPVKPGKTEDSLSYYIMNVEMCKYSKNNSLTEFYEALPVNILTLLCSLR